MNAHHLIVEIGFALGLFVNALLFIPQIFAILKSQSAKEVSLITFLGFNIIQLFTFFHGIIQHDYLLAFGYLLSIVSCGAVSALIIYYDYIFPKIVNSK